MDLEIIQTCHRTWDQGFDSDLTIRPVGFKAKSNPTLRILTTGNEDSKLIAASWAGSLAELGLSHDQAVGRLHQPEGNRDGRGAAAQRSERGGRDQDLVHYLTKRAIMNCLTLSLILIP